MKKKAIGYVLAALIAVTLVVLHAVFDIKVLLFGIPPLLLGFLLLFCVWLVWIVKTRHKKPQWRTILLLVAYVICLVLFVVCWFGKMMDFNGGYPYYVEATEPETGRTFVAECEKNMKNYGSVKLYERHFIFIVPCDTEVYKGGFLHEEPSFSFSEDGTEIWVAFFFAPLVFAVPR